MDDDLTEAEIVAGLQAGNRHAWDELCQQYSRRVWTYVARFLGRDQNAAADVFQETLLAVARSGRSLGKETRLWPWLATIAHNQVALHWRNLHRRRSEPLITDPLTDDDTPEHRLRREESNDDVRFVLSQISAVHSALLTAKYIDECSVAEIVEEFGGTTESVRSKLARARQAFAEQFEKNRNFSQRH